QPATAPVELLMAGTGTAVGPSVAGSPSAPQAQPRRSLLRDSRPWMVTGGWPAAPFVVLLLVAALDQIDTRLFGVLGPEIKDYFGLDLGSIGALVTFAGILALVIALPIGYLVDRVRRTRLAALGAFATGVFGICTGFAPTV